MSAPTERDRADARRYLSGELVGPDAAAFERRLAEGTGACEALAEAVGEAAPDPAWRDRARRRLRRRLLARQAVAWSGVAAAAAAVVAVLALPMPQPPVAVTELAAPEPVAEEPAPANAAAVWATLPPSDHLRRAVADEERRRQRAEERQAAVSPEGRRGWLLQAAPKPPAPRRVIRWPDG